MNREFDADMISGLSEEERFVLQVAAVLDSSLGVLSPFEQAQLDAARRSALLRAGQAPEQYSTLARTLSTSAEQIPDDILSRLDGIRSQAIAKARERQRLETSSRLHWDWLRLPRAAGAFASICVLVATLAVFNTGENPDVMPVALSEDGLLIASADELELYQNFEFYQWLAENGL